MGIVTPSKSSPVPVFVVSASWIVFTSRPAVSYSWYVIEPEGDFSNVTCPSSSR